VETAGDLIIQATGLQYLNTQQTKTYRHDIGTVTIGGLGSLVFDRQG